MLRSLKHLYGSKLGATDGEIGHVKDFYFDDQAWAVRYVVVDSGSWLPGRQVLLSPHSLACLDPVENVLRVDLTRKQIEDSPSIESHKPVSRRYEEEYYRYYGWPYYWLGNGLWGLSGFPILELPAQSLLNEPAFAREPQSEVADAHLRSTQVVGGYQLRLSDGTIGHIVDFMMDSKSWAIGQLVIRTGHRFSGKDVLIPTKEVDRISYDESMVITKFTETTVENKLPHRPSSVDATH